MIRIPEHEKLKEVSEKSQVCGSFVDWLESRGFYKEAMLAQLRKGKLC